MGDHDYRKLGPTLQHDRAPEGLLSFDDLERDRVDKAEELSVKKNMRGDHSESPLAADCRDSVRRYYTLRLGSFVEAVESHIPVPFPGLPVVGGPRVLSVMTHAVTHVKRRCLNARSPFSYIATV